MKPKPLPSAEYLRSLFEYDPATGILRWRLGIGRARCGGHIAGTPRERRKDEQPYLTVAIDLVYYPVHRIVWKIVTGEEPEGMIDHDDLDRQNNRWANLRPATNGQNKHNGKIYANNKSGVKGVCWDHGHQKWRAYISVNGNQIKLGRFDSIAEASSVVLAKRLELHGEFARTE